MTQSDLIFEAPAEHHAEILQKLNTIFQPYADTAYGTLLSWWNLYDDLSLCVLNKNIVVQSSYPTLGKKISHTIIGCYQIEKTLMQVFDYQIGHAQETILYSMPEYHLRALGGHNNLEVTHEPDTTEYILSAEQQTGLQGKDFYMIRHKVNHFEHTYSLEGIECREINLNLTSSQKLLINSLLNWGKSTKNDDEKLEELVILNSLQLQEVIELRCYGVFVNGNLVSFALYKSLPRSYVNLNHLRVSPNHKDAFIYTLHKISAYLHSQKIVYINIEQDLGIEGLRIFKQRLRPVEMLNKYTIKLV